MVKAIVGALALAALPSTLAFRNTSPFFLFSTSEVTFDTGASVVQSDKINSQVFSSLKKCPSHTYVVVRQEGVSSQDFVDSRSAPRLGLYLSGEAEGIKSANAVPEVVGNVNGKSIARLLAEKCGADFKHIDGSSNLVPYLVEDGLLTEILVDDIPSLSSASKHVLEISFPAPPANRRAKALEQYDSILDDVIEKAAGSDYTVIYTTTPQSEEQAVAALQAEQMYEMESPFEQAVHMELRRDMSTHDRRAAHDKRALFEKYQFFTPAIFMAFAAIIPLLLVLFVGMRSIASLEVSYFAFSKEMGPSGQKKQ
ncbi:BIG1-domain-containing protein [Delitschia confertaspora ATCC 74209]|uniref:Protein BIG1 n=1 Tax=Delitschia confertaspora ATCC 74209 TaxID=1513339 RepID=A0A9P4JKJ1_9PLEO|nr:BIG1-domain-containing protein [Delitschia confertaspora ATCC 74209]